MTGSPSFAWVPLDLEGRTSLDGVLPQSAVIAGWEHYKPTYIARTRHEGHWELGKLNAWAKFGYSYCGKEIEASQGEVLVAENLQSPVWINGAYGEHVDNVFTSKARDHTQLVGRAWHKDRWIPGKVVPFCRRFYFAFGGRELSTRKYQLLSTEFAWERLPAEGGFPTQTVPVDSCMPLDTLNCLLLPFPHSTLVEKKIKVLTRSNLQESLWVVSGDGEYLRHALTNEDGYQLARAWVDGKGGVGRWVEGFVNDGAFQTGIFLGCDRHVDYQVLLASPVPQKPPTNYELSSRLLSLSISLDTLEGMLENELTPPESIFMVTKLDSGEAPWTAVKEMVTSDKTVQSKLPRHLWSMMPAIEEMAAAEGDTVGKASRAQSQQQPESADQAQIAS